MSSVPPTIVVKSVDGVDPTVVDDKRIAIEKILDDGKFWNKFAKAFMDCTIGKRVLLALVSEVDEQGKPVGDAPIKFRFYTMPEFLYEYDPNDCDKLIKVQIAYQDESTVGKLQNEQRWHKWIYEMRGETCWCTYMVVDGTNTIAYAEVPNVMSSSIAGEEQGGNGQSDLARYAHGGTVLAEICKRQIFGHLERAVHARSQCKPYRLQFSVAFCE